MGGGRKRSRAVLRDPRPARRDLEPTEMECGLGCGCMMGEGSNMVLPLGTQTRMSVSRLLAGKVDGSRLWWPRGLGYARHRSRGKGRKKQQVACNQRGHQYTLVPTPSLLHSSHPRLPVSNSPRESPRKEKGDLGVPGPLSVAPASWILISCHSRETGSRG